MNKTTKHLEDNFVDVCGGKMKLTDVCREIIHYTLLKRPKRMIIDIEKRKGIGYYTKIYIPEKDFTKKTKEDYLYNLPK